MKRPFIFYVLLILSVSCKSEKENKKYDVSDSKKEIIIDEDISAIKQGLDNYWEVEAPNKSKIIVNMNKVYFLKENPTENDTTVRYFMHVKLKNGELINMDFNYKDHELEAKKQSEFKNYAIAHRELTIEPIFSILVGQFDENGRLWQMVLHEQNFY